MAKDSLTPMWKSAESLCGGDSIYATIQYK